MNWEEIAKAILAYMKTWTTTSIIFPGQSTKAATSEWVEIHILDMNQIFSRKQGKDRGNVLMQIGIFSTQENVYRIPIVFAALQAFIGQHDISSTHYAIRFGEIEGGRVVFSGVAASGSQNIEKNIQHAPCSLTATCTEL